MDVILMALSESACYCPAKVVLTEWNVRRQAEKGIEAMIQNSVDLLEHAIDYAKSRGFIVRMETLDGVSGGYCRIGGEPCIFLDQASTADQQLSEMMRTLERFPHKQPGRNDMNDGKYGKNEL